MEEGQTTRKLPEFIFGYPKADLTIMVDKVYLTETGEELGTLHPEGFTIDSQDKCDYAMGKLFDAQNDLNEAERKVKALLTKYNAKKLTLERRLASDKAFFEPLIEEFAKAQITDKKKFVDTPYGRVKFIDDKGGKLSVIDPEKALASAKKCGWDTAIDTNESFKISLLSEEQIIEAKGLEDSGFKVSEPARKCYIKVEVGV